MIISITGSRNLTVTFADIEAHLPDGVTGIVSGGASGVDSVAYRFARSRGLLTSVIRPDYKSVSVSLIAPLVRNTDIISQADYCLFFWDGVSRGTKDTISKAVKAGKHGKVIVIGSCVRNSIIRF